MKGKILNKISDYNGPKSNDTFELTTINGIPIFVSAEWREASDGSQSIADWVYETNKPVSPICYFKKLSKIYTVYNIHSDQKFHII